MRQAGNLKWKFSILEFFIILSLLVVHDFINKRMDLLVIDLWRVDKTNVSPLT